MREGGTRSHLLGPDPLLPASASCVARGDPCSATANCRTSFAAWAPRGGGGEACQAGWRRATHAARGDCQRLHLARLPAPIPIWPRHGGETRNTQPASSPSAPKVTSSRHSLREGCPLPVTSACFTWPEPTPGEQAPHPNTLAHTQAHAGKGVSYRFQPSQAAHQSPK